MHERYRQLNYDVALLQLSRPIQMSNKARAVCLPQHGSRARTGTQCYITGERYLYYLGGTLFSNFQQIKIK